MKRLRKGIGNQTIGLLPLLLFFGMNLFLPHLISFMISVAFSALCYLLYKWLRGSEGYQFVLFPVAITQMLYSVSLLFVNPQFLEKHSALFVEILFVIVLAFTYLQKQKVRRMARNVEMGSDKQGYLIASLNEFFFTIQIIQGAFTLHLFVVLFYLLLPEAARNSYYEPLLFNYMPLIAGFGIMLYERVRLIMLRGFLKHEVWLPVLNDNGSVVGRVAHSISAASARKFYHPVVRVAVVYNGMLYLTKRDSGSIISPNALDYPFKYYVRYQQGIEEAAYDALSCCFSREAVSPRFLIRYKFENELVKHQVSVYVVYLHTEEQFACCKDATGKLWTSKQIEDNLGTGLFSEYFEKEFTYLQNTVLMVESYCCQQGGLAEVEV
ncbi:hypothetical protein [Massilibacteroides vaginae]|uniref:hypothetical protein n=1 Tax=Massilibacteroides vaginae TaxID=1673718 RepID=UPI000A1CEA1B|nr:hypothetical protein [Massilibacteroides vaginae]